MTQTRDLTATQTQTKEPPLMANPLEDRDPRPRYVNLVSEPASRLHVDLFIAPDQAGEPAGTVVVNGTPVMVVGDADSTAARADGRRYAWAWLAAGADPYTGQVLASQAALLEWLDEGFREHGEPEDLLVDQVSVHLEALRNLAGIEQIIAEAHARHRREGYES